MSYMSAVRFVIPLGIALISSACTENTAPGNDREAALSPPEAPAEVTDAASAAQGAATDLLIPQAMTDADVRNAPDLGDRCLFRFTKVGLPVFLYGSDGVLKLNGKLAVLPATTSGDGDAGVRQYASDPVTVTVQPLGDVSPGTDPDAAGLISGELILQLAGATHELGYHGFVECDGRGG